MQKDWHICEVDCRLREIVNKKVPQVLEFKQADENSVDSPAARLTEEQMFEALEAPGHKRLRFDDLSHIIQDSESSRVTLKFLSCSNQKCYDLKGQEYKGRIYVDIRTAARVGTPRGVGL